MGGAYRNRNGVLNGTPLYLVTLAVLLAAVPLSIMAAVTFGTMRLPLRDVYSVIRYELGSLLLRRPIPEAYTAGAPLHDVVWLIRLPRLVLAAVVGAGLSVSGVVMQAIVKNPLADPYVLGVSSGASLGVTLAVMLGVGVTFGGNYIGLMAFAGAFAMSLAVVALANIGGRATSVKLLLAGSALSALCSAGSNFIIYISDAKEASGKVIKWMMGSLAAANWSSNAVIAAVVAAGTLFFCTQFRTLNLMLLGDDSAVTLGTDLHRWRILYLVVASLLVGFAVYNAGVIGFVGLIIPHGVRLVFGTDHKKLIPLSALIGAVFLIWADVLCRTILPGNEMPIGILTSLLGAPVFIYLMARKRYGFGGGD